MLKSQISCFRPGSLSEVSFEATSERRIEFQYGGFFFHRFSLSRMLIGAEILFFFWRFGNLRPHAPPREPLVTCVPKAKRAV